MNDVKETQLSTVREAIGCYRNDIMIRTAIMLMVSVCCLLRSPADTITVLPFELPAPVFYIMIATAIISVFTFGALGYIRGLPLLDIEQAVEDGKSEEAKSVLKKMNRRNIYFDFFDDFCLFLSVPLIFIPFLFGYSTNCPDCNAELPANATVCSQCASETDFDKDIVKYITEYFQK